MINLGPSTFDKFGGPDHARKLWTVRWQSAVTRFHEGGELAGTMQRVTGDIYQNGAIASTFESQSGRVERKSNKLWLSGQVKVISRDPQVVLTCREIEYDGDTETIKAKGDVRIEGAMGLVSGVEELWTTPDLDRVATPDLFKKR